MLKSLNILHNVIDSINDLQSIVCMELRTDSRLEVIPLNVLQLPCALNCKGSKAVSVILSHLERDVLRVFRTAYESVFQARKSQEIGC